MTETSPASFTIPYEVDDPNRVLTYVGELLPHLEVSAVPCRLVAWCHVLGVDIASTASHYCC